MADIVTKEDLLGKLQTYTSTPDDETVQYKEIIKKTLIQMPELLYAINEKDLESELFDKDGNINWDKETHEPLGEWDSYFGETANIRPFLFIPQTQTTVRNFLCYQVGFNQLPSDSQKYTEITFNILIHGQDTIDKLTGIPRHDLIASILRERINWHNTFGRQCHMTSSKESITDTNYVVRTLVFQVVDTNGISTTPYKGKTTTTNYQLRK